MVLVKQLSFYIGKYMTINNYYKVTKQGKVTNNNSVNNFVSRLL